MPDHQLTYSFSLLSPWSYLGHEAAMALVRRHDVRVDWRPIDLLALFPESGGLPLAKRHPKRQAYRDVELQRWRLRRRLPLNIRPTFWPVDIRLADGAVIAIAAANRDPDSFVRHAFAALWAENADLADPATVMRLLQASGHDAAMIEAARSPATLAAYRGNTEAALADGVFGAPTYGWNGELFWGQDRLDLLEDAIESGRPPFRA